MPFIRQPDRVGRNASDVSAADWRNQTHVKNYRKFICVWSTTFLRAGNPCKTGNLGWKSLLNTAVFVINILPTFEWKLKVLEIPESYNNLIKIIIYYLYSAKYMWIWSNALSESVFFILTSEFFHGGSSDIHSEQDDNKEQYIAIQNVK